MDIPTSLDGADSDSERQTELTDASMYMRRLERLVRKVIGLRFHGASDIWQLQLDLLQLQREIQNEITVMKAKSRKEGRADLDTLRNARWHARRFGDAIAWLLLGLNRQHIYPLGQNSRVPIEASEDHGSRGMIAMAGLLANEGWGFPLLHDITDCLRIGDVTFIGQNVPIRTVEIKTRLIDERAVSNEQTTFEYRVRVQFVAGDGQDPALAAMPREGTESSSTEKVLTWRSSPRIERQFGRLKQARLRQFAEPYSVVDVESGPLISLPVTSSHSQYWENIRRVVRRARRAGYASECVDSTFMYVAIYRPNGVDVDAARNPQIGADLIASDFLFAEPKRNAILINTIPTREPDGPPHQFLPFYLYSLPQTSILDLLNGRLVILVIVNIGRILAALEDAGFEVPTLKEPTIFSVPLSVETEIEVEELGRYRIQIRGLPTYINEMIYEFRSVQHLIQISTAMREGAKSALKQLNERVS